MTVFDKSQSLSITSISNNVETLREPHSNKLESQQYSTPTLKFMLISTLVIKYEL
jgi:hypothetical protein